MTFDGGGLKAYQDGARVAGQPWSRVTDLDIKVPYSSKHVVTALRVWDMVSPKSASFSAAQVEISVTAKFEVARWAFMPRTTFDWRIQFILDDLLRLLAPDFSPLGCPGLLDDAVGEVAPRIGPHARLLMYTDLLGLDRLLGGHTAYDPDLQAVVDRHVRG